MTYSDDEAYGGFPTDIQLHDGYVQLGWIDPAGFDQVNSILNNDEFRALVKPSYGQAGYPTYNIWGLPLKISNRVFAYELNNEGDNGGESAVYGLFCREDDVEIIRQYTRRAIRKKIRCYRCDNIVGDSDERGGDIHLVPGTIEDTEAWVWLCSTECWRASMEEINAGELAAFGRSYYSDDAAPYIPNHYPEYREVENE